MKAYKYIYGNNKNLKIGRGMGRNGSYNTFTGVIGGSNNAITPIIPISCANCGNTVFINPLVVGLINKE